jgi:hypothetical protein
MKSFTVSSFAKKDDQIKRDKIGGDMWNVGQMRNAYKI